MSDDLPVGPAPEASEVGYRARPDAVQLRHGGRDLPVAWVGLRHVCLNDDVARLWAPGGPVWLVGGKASLGPLQVAPAETPGRLRLGEDPASLRRAGAFLTELLAAGRLAPPAGKEEPWREFVTDPALVDARLAALVAWRSTVRLSTPLGTIQGRFAGRATGGLRVVVDARPPAGPLEVAAQGYNSLYCFEAPTWTPAEGGILLPPPAQLLRLQHRRAPRAAARAGLVVSFVHPLLPGVRVQRPLLDVSRNGLRFAARVDEDLVHAGLTLPVLEVSGPGLAPLRFSGQVRLVLAGGADGVGGCGVRLTPATTQDAARWRDLVGGLLLPGTRVGRVWSEHLWELFETSGYLKLSGRTPAHFAPLRTEFANIVRKLDRAPDVGCKVVWPSERGVEASISFLRLYRHAWFGYEIAKRPGNPPSGVPGPQVLFAIHSRAYEMAQSDPEVRWVMGFVQQVARWSKRVHFDLPARYASTGQSGIYEFRTWQVPVDGLDPLARAFEVDRATSSHVDALLAHLAAERAVAYRETLDLVPERIDLAGVSEAWRAGGLRRERILLAARRGRGGPVVAVAVAEAVDPGVHLFGLLDVLRLYPLRPEGRAAYPSLVRSAADWYRTLGRSSFSLHAEDLAYTPAGGQDMGIAYLTTLSSSLIPSFLEHLFEITAPGPR